MVKNMAYFKHKCVLLFLFKIQNQTDQVRIKDICPVDKQEMTRLLTTKELELTEYNANASENHKYTHSYINILCRLLFKVYIFSQTYIFTREFKCFLLSLE